MKWMLRVVVLAAAMLPAMVCADSSVQGNWQGQIAGDKPTPVYMQLTVTGADVTGSLIIAGGEVGIKDGHISGAVVEFTSQGLQIGGHDFVNWSGLIGDDQISFNVIDTNREGPVTEIVVNRQK